MWIEINLPWRCTEQSEKQKAYYAENDAFLKWLRAERTKRFGTSLDLPPAVISDDIQRLGDAAPELRDRERWHEQAWLASIQFRYSAPDQEVIRQLAHWRHHSALYQQWQSGDPEVKAWTQRLEELRQLTVAEAPTREFRSHPMCRPGVLIETNEPAVMLIGHINPLGGVCDDCSIEQDVIILRYHDLRLDFTPMKYR